MQDLPRPTPLSPTPAILYGIADALILLIVELSVFPVRPHPETGIDASETNASQTVFGCQRGAEQLQ